MARYTQGSNIDEPLVMLRSSTASHYQADGLGSITSLSNAAGTLAETYAFDSFGNRTASSGSLTNPFQYAGRDLDSETSLYYMRARYLDPSTGRFMSEDPLRFEGGEPDFYVYAAGNPANLRDPSGLAECVYSISQHTMVCTENAVPPVGPPWQLQLGPSVRALTKERRNAKTILPVPIRKT